MGFASGFASGLGGSGSAGGGHTGQMVEGAEGAGRPAQAARKRAGRSDKSGCIIEFNPKKFDTPNLADVDAP